jgi:hypothetical protein
MEKYTPARKISNRHGLGKVTGLFFSDKMNMHIAWESQLERDYCYLLDFNKKIKRFFSQPKTFNFTYSGRKIRYTPDFYIEYIDGSSEYIEIKFSNVLENLKIARKLKILKNYFIQNGIQYKILFEDDIRKQPRLRNIKFLKKYCKIVYMPKDPLEFYGKLKDLRQYIDDQYIYSAMYKGLIKFDINEEINENLSIRLEVL